MGSVLCCYATVTSQEGFCSFGVVCTVESRCLCLCSGPAYPSGISASHFQYEVVILFQELVKCR